MCVRKRECVRVCVRESICGRGSVRAGVSERVGVRASVCVIERGGGEGWGLALTSSPIAFSPSEGGGGADPRNVASPGHSSRFTYNYFT